MRFIIVELDNGEQQFFDRMADGFRWAKEQEDKRRHSVEFVSEFINDESIRMYTGQDLRWLLRSLDNVQAWIKSG